MLILIRSFMPRSSFSLLAGGDGANGDTNDRTGTVEDTESFTVLAGIMLVLVVRIEMSCVGY